MIKTILLVGASPATRVLLPTLLRDWPATIVSAPDVLSAIHIADRVCVNAIIAEPAHARVGAQDLPAFAAASPRLSSADVYVLKHTGGETPLKDLSDRGSPLIHAPPPSDAIAALGDFIEKIEAALTP
jgi:hypothetical protein